MAESGWLATQRCIYGLVLDCDQSVNDINNFHVAVEGGDLNFQMSKW